MSSNDPNNQGNNPTNRGRHGEQGYRTFPTDGSRESSEAPRSSSEVPRTFPSGSNGPARVSPPVAPSPHSNSHHPGPNQGQSQGYGPGQESGPGGQGSGAQGPGAQGPGAQGPGAQGPGAQGSGVPDQNPTRMQPTHVQPPVDPPPGRPGGERGQHGPSGQDSAQRGQQGYGPGYNTPAGNAPSGANYPNGPTSPGQPNSPADTNPYGNPYAQPGAGQASAGAAGFGHMAEQQTSGGYPTQGPSGYQAGPGGPEGQGPGGPNAYGSPGPYEGGAPPRREKRGPGWGATIAIAVIAALLGGGAAFGGSYALTALGEDEPRKVANQTIETPDWTEVAKATSQSVVSIQVGTNGQVQALGSGSLYDDKGHVITNNHVVAPADTPTGEITVTMKNGDTTKADIVGRDPSTDIAVIKLDQAPADVDPLPVGDSKKLSVGDPVMALGNPLGLADSVTTGIVSALDRPVSTENIGEDASSQEKEMTITNAIQTDAAINPGNSGGPLVDGDGNFIGVNSAAASLSQAGEGGQSGSIGIGFAIPSQQAVMIADQLISSGKALHPFLGITLTDGQINKGGTTRGSAKVQSVQSGSPAAAAGFKDGDDIVSVAGTKVNNAIALRALVRAQPTNTPVEFTVIRGGQEQTLKASLVLK